MEKGTVIGNSINSKVIESQFEDNELDENFEED